MANSATIGDFLVLMAVGRHDAKLQRHYIAQQSQHPGKRERAQTGFGRPYHTQTHLASFDQIALVRAAKHVVNWAASPYRTIAALGKFDARNTR